MILNYAFVLQLLVAKETEQHERCSKGLGTNKNQNRCWVTVLNKSIITGCFCCAFFHLYGVNCPVSQSDWVQGMPVLFLDLYYVESLFRCFNFLSASKVPLVRKQ